MNQTFKDKVVIITGGCSGIGRAAALQFAAAGAKLFLADLSEKAGDETVDAIEKLGAKATFARIDVTDVEDIERMVADCILAFGTVDILVNSAGILGPRARTEKYPAVDFQKVMDVNVVGLWNCMKATLPHLLAKRSGCVVNVASVAGLLGFGGHVAYAASKHAVMGITKSAAVEYAKYGIRINAVCPAFTQTPMMDTELMNDDSNYFEVLQQSIPMKRFAQPDEIAAGILYLASDAASFMTGHGLVLDGGLVVV